MRPVASAAPAGTSKDQLRARFVARTVLPVATVGAGALGAPHALTAVLVVAGLGLMGVLLAQKAKGPASDTAAVLIGAALSIFVLAGLVLGAIPAGLTYRSWTAALSLVELAVVALTVHTSIPRRAQRVGTRRPTRTVAWYAAGSAALAASLVLSVTATERADQAPVSLSIGPSGGTPPAVEVASGRTSGPLTLTEVAGGQDHVLRAAFVVRPGHPDLIALDPALSGVVTVQIAAAGASQPMPLASLRLKAG